MVEHPLSRTLEPNVLWPFALLRLDRDHRPVIVVVCDGILGGRDVECLGMSMVVVISVVVCR